METTKVRRPRIQRVVKSKTIDIAHALSELYSVDYKEVIKVYSSQGWNLEATKMILNLKTRSHA